MQASPRDAPQGHYRAFSVKVNAESHQRHASYIPAVRRRSTHAGETSEGEAGGKGGKKGAAGKKDAAKGGGKKGKKASGGGDANTDGEEGAGSGKAKKGAGGAGKKGGGGGKKGGKKGDGDGGGGGPWGPGLDSATLRLLSTLELRARQLAPVMINLACGSSLSAYQVMHLLRLLPDFDLRVKVLVAVWPAIWDRGNMVDLILDLDHPVALPPSPRKIGGEGGLMPLTSSSITGAGPAGPGSNRQSGEHRRSTFTGMPGAPAAGAPGAASPGPASPSRPGQGQGQGAGVTEPGVIRPKNFVPSPHTGDELLLKVAGELGWRSLLLCWSSPGALQGRTLHLHLGAIDQLQAVASICRFADRCYRVLRHQVVTGLACDGTARDPEEAAELPGGVWQLILSRTVLCLDRPEYGTLSLQLDGITHDAQRAVAAVTIQAVWRGYLVRRAAYASAVYGAGSNRWLRCWRVVRHLRRLALMRTLAADLDISRAQSEMERGYLRMLYGPNAA
ncbi:hypothetical protein PLESTM_001347200 [Pleodorina starrii]|nr:hypothetical protein PLESTM_001347200 [Pleodorina starrii]